MPKGKLWDLEPHTEAKHKLLQRYLGAWFPVLSRYNGRIVFFDGFAGPGEYADGEPGSPVLALQTLLDHHHLDRMKSREFLFIFNEADGDRCRHLSSVVNEIKMARSPWPRNVRVEVTNGKFEDTAEGMLAHLADQKAQLAPTFAFVDPFGVSGMPIELLGRLLNFAKCEVFVFFNYNEINRFATAGNIDQRLEELFGTDEFKYPPPPGDPGRKPFFHDLYERQLKSVCRFPYVQSFEMVNARNHTGHYMFYGTRSVDGLRVMKEAMWKVDPTGGYRFSDRLAGQDVLFGGDADTRPLQRALSKHFASQTVSINAVEEYTLVHTPFATGHIKKLTLKPMQKSGLISSPNQRRAGTFPDGTLITFSD